MNRLALEMLAPVPGDRVLEIGFGGGGLVAALLERGCDVVGIDVSDAAVARAKRRLPGADFRQASVEHMPLADGGADKAVSLNSLYFWPDARLAMRELARVLRPGGRLVLLFEPPDELRKWPGYRHGFRLFEPSEVRALMAAAGFVGIEERWGRGRKPDLFCGLSGTRGGANG